MDIDFFVEDRLGACHRYFDYGHLYLDILRAQTAEEK